MVDRRDVGSWLEGPKARTLEPGEYPGRRIGMPQAGPGSIARFGRRLAAIFVDWVLCQLAAYGLFGVQLTASGGESFIPLAIFAVENVVLVWLTGSTVGHRLLGIGVMSVDGSRARLVPVLLRTLLLCLAIPALVWDRDGRGLHDKAAHTVIVRR